MSDLDAVLDAIMKRSRLLIAGHVDPDPDCVGSMLALDWLCEKLGKESLPISHDPALPQWSFLPRIERLVLAGSEGPWREALWDGMIVVDCEVERTGDAQVFAGRGVQVINIDHHVTNPGTGDVNLIRTDAAAAGEIVFDLIDRAGVGFDAGVATLLYAALMADTGSFRFSNTSPRAFEIASRLVREGARPDLIAREIYDTRSWSYVRLLGRALETLKRSPGGRVAWMSLTQRMIAEEGARKNESEGFIQYPRMIDGVEVAILLRELEDGSVRVGLRSRESVDVSALAQEFGGGGHARAAGCTLAGPMETAEAKVVARALQLAGETE